MWTKLKLDIGKSKRDTFILSVYIRLALNRGLLKDFS